MFFFCQVNLSYKNSRETVLVSLIVGLAMDELSDVCFHFLLSQQALIPMVLGCDKQHSFYAIIHLSDFVLSPPNVNSSSH